MRVVITYFCLIVVNKPIGQIVRQSRVVIKPSREDVIMHAWVEIAQHAGKYRAGLRLPFETVAQHASV